MKQEEFLQLVNAHNEGKDYGLCPQPYPADKGLNILIDHLLGEDWYSVMPMGSEQVYTEAIYSILGKYEKKQSLACRLTDGVADACSRLLHRCSRGKRS